MSEQDKCPKCGDSDDCFCKKCGTRLFHRDLRRQLAAAVKRAEKAEATIERLRSGLGMIMRCAGAPDPAGALHTVIQIARRALAAEAAKEHGNG
jgi:hypothetical protein